MELEELVKYGEMARVALEEAPPESTAKRKRPPKRQVVVRLEPAQIAELEAVASQRGQRRSDVIRAAITAFLPNAG